MDDTQAGNPVEEHIKELTLMAKKLIDRQMGNEVEEGGKKGKLSSLSKIKN